MIDLNDVAPARPAERFDLDRLVAQLRATARSWVPAHFPRGRREGHEWRLGGIDGRPPRKQGSCVVALDGPNAGDWIDFDGSGSGGPLSALEQATELAGYDLFAYAAGLVGGASSLVTKSTRSRAAAPMAAAGPARGAHEAAVETEVRHILARAVPLAGTLAERWLAARGVTTPATDDLRFVADLTHFETKTGWPGMVGTVRGHDGAVLGLHRTYLALDGTAKAPVRNARMSLGEVHGGAVRLAKAVDGLIGLAEGIETTLAVMTACPDLPMWAALSAGSLADQRLPEYIRRVVVCADHDAAGAGLDAARRLAVRLVDEGRSVFIALPPRAGDDFNDVLLRDRAEEVRRVVEAAEPYEPSPPGGPAPSSRSSSRAARGLPLFFPDRPSNRPLVRADDGDLARLAGTAWEQLIEANSPPWLFRTAARLVWVERDDEGAPLVRFLDEDRMAHALARIADWRRASAKGDLVPVSPPARVVKDVLVTADPLVPVLAGIVAAPIFGRDGAVETTPGYLAGSAVLFEAEPGFAVGEIPAKPSGDEVAAAKALLLDELLGDFPFTSDAERAHAVALLLLPFARAMINGPTPLHLIEKPTPGTGATLMVDAVATIVTGRPANIMTEGRDEDEWRKRLTAKLRSMPVLLVIDNVRGKLDSSALAAALTAPSWEDRLLGRSEMVQFPIRCCWIATGNNPELSNEIARRIVRIRLDAGVDQPWRRETFRHPELLGWLHEKRAALVRACLLLVQNWIAAGRPRSPKRVGSFEAWSSIMGGILSTAGIPGFLGNIDELYERSDSESESWRSFVTRWWSEFRTAPVRVAEILPLALSAEPPLPVFAATEHGQRIKLGSLLSRVRDRVFAVDHYQLRVGQNGLHEGVMRWRLAIEAGDERTTSSKPGGSEPARWVFDSETHRKNVEGNQGRGGSGGRSGSLLNAREDSSLTYRVSGTIPPRPTDPPDPQYSWDSSWWVIHYPSWQDPTGPYRRWLAAWSRGPPVREARPSPQTHERDGGPPVAKQVGPPPRDHHDTQEDSS